MTTTALVPWTPTQAIDLPANAQPSEIVERAIQLNERDQRAIVSAFQLGAYEMVATFVWTKALTALKKQLAELGMAFVGEMLGRPDLDEGSNPITELREDEAIGLAEQLGMIGTTEALRLRNAQALILHFTDPEVSQKERLHLEEAVSILRSCVVNILSDLPVKSQHPFLELRRKLQSETLTADAPELERLAGAPYFYIRTTLTVLLTQLKHAIGANLEHAAGNINVLLPVMWDKVRDKDRWQCGETYALVHAENRRIAAAELRAALSKVKGFDFVPETLRSDTFRSAAKAVLDAHFGFNNFHNEPRPMLTLARLGSSIPGPVVGDCFTAALCVQLGNRYGRSWAAQSAVHEFLKLCRPNQWEYYLNKVLVGDRYILEKLAFEESPLVHWQELVDDLKLGDLTIIPRVAPLVYSDPTKRQKIKQTAQRLRERLMQEA